MSERDHLAWFEDITQLLERKFDLECAIQGEALMAEKMTRKGFDITPEHQQAVERRKQRRLAHIRAIESQIAAINAGVADTLKPDEGGA